MERILIRSQDLLQGIPAEVSDNQIGVGYTAVVLSADAQATIAALQAMNNRLGGRVETLEAQLTQRTAERDTARRRVDELEAREVDVVLLRDDLEQRTAELEAAKREREVWKEKAELRGKEACEQRAELERVRDQFADLRKMVAALPKVEGEITEDSSDHGGEIRDGNGYVHYYATSRAKVRALLQVLQHRQGMEG